MDVRSSLHCATFVGKGVAASVLARVRPDRGPCPSLVALRAAYGDSGPAPEVLYFGDSVAHLVSRHDEDRRPLATMVRDALAPTLAMASIVEPAFHAEVYLSLVRALATLQQRPRVVVVPVNLRSFSPEWALNPKWQCNEVLRALEHYLANPAGDVPSVRNGVAGTGAERWRYLNARVDYPRHPGAKVADFHAVIADRPTAPEAQARRREAIFTFHHLFPLPADGPGLRALGQLAREVDTLGCRLLTYVTPLNHEAGTRVIGETFVTTVAEHVATVEATLRAGRPTAAPPRDWSRLLPADAFFHDLDPTEHLNEQGRSHLCAELVAAIATLEDRPG